jgi:hypothetical protein
MIHSRLVVSLITFLPIINSMKLTSFFLCFMIKMLDKRIIYTECMYNCLYHDSSVGKVVSLRDANVSCLVSWKSRITTRREASSNDTAFPSDETWYKQLYIHFVYIIHLSNIFMRVDMKSVYAETLYIYNLNVSSEQAEFLCNPNVKLYKIVIKN